MTASNLDRFHEEFWRDLESSELKPVEEYLRKYPDCAAEIRKAHAHAMATGRTQGPPARSKKTTEDSSPPPPPPPRHSRPAHIGPYRILDVLGEGGMGTVYLAEQKEPVRRRVALKVIKLGMDSKAVLRRFGAERQALAMMEHGSIARVYDCGVTESGQPYFAMEYVKGEPITRYCDDNKLDIQDRLDLFLQICSGVQHAHNKGVIHRDLTPNNVLVTVQDGKPRVKIIDFGLARATDHRLVEATIFTEQGQIVGTPEYMSPEQAGLNALDIDTRTDIYTLGVLLYELLVGELPFARDALRRAGLMEMQRIIREEDPPKPSTRLTTIGDRTSKVAQRRRMDLRTLIRHLEGDLDWIVMRAMEKDRTRRYETPSELASDIRRHLGHEPVLASPPSVGYRLHKFTRRYRVQVAAGIAVFLVLVAGIITSWIFYLRADAQYLRAEGETQEKEKQRALAVANAERAIREAEAARRERIRTQEEKARFDRLAVVVRLAEAEKKQQDLYPAWPDKVGALQRWLQDHGRPLRGELPRIRQTLQELEGIAPPLTEVEKQKDRENHPRYRWYLAQQKKVDALQLMIRLAEGKARSDPVAVPADAPRDVDKLNRRAWDLVKPERKAQDHGQEALGLALIQRALQVAPVEDRKRHIYLDTLAWALLANGRFAEARAASKEAWEAAPKNAKPTYERLQEKLDKAIADARKNLDKARKDLSRLEADVNRRQTFHFADEADEFLHTTLRRVEQDLVTFVGKKGTFIDVQDRLSWAKKVGQLTLHHPKAQVTWEEARQAILKADDNVASRLYADPPIDLEPQTGLVPIGKNPVTKLWEFYHLRSAWDPARQAAPEDVEIPEHGEDGRLKMAGRGIVLVLIPGGTFLMGAQKTAKDAPNHDPLAEADETPNAVTLSPYFLSRYEMTQGQWARLSGGEFPSVLKLGHEYIGSRGPIGDAHPVESVSWEDSQELLSHHALTLPTEAQWEYACRARTSTPWYTGREPRSLAKHANVLDASAVGRYPAMGKAEEFEDGYALPAPVGTYEANDFGLHDVHGNLWELCSDRYGEYRLPPRPGDGLRQGDASFGENYVVRGGSYSEPARRMRSAFRGRIDPTGRLGSQGVRPARGIAR